MLCERIRVKGEIKHFFSDCSEAIIVKTRMDKEEGFKNLFFRADLGYDIFPFVLTIILDNGLKIKLDFSGFFRSFVYNKNGIDGKVTSNKWC